MSWSNWTAIAVGVLLAAFLFATRSNEFSLSKLFLPTSPVMHIGDVPIRVTIADTNDERIAGLSGKEGLDESEGLLFVFPSADYHAMWMKDMRFPIDIIWIGEDARVISVNENVSPDSFPRTFRPARPAKYAVETNAHFVKTFGIHEGEDARLPMEYLENPK